MRLIILGATTLGTMTAANLIEQAHDVVIIEQDHMLIEEAGTHLDCSFIKGDGSKPDIVKEAKPEETDIFYGITNHDQTNIIACLVAKSLGVKRVVTLIEDPEFLPICNELGLTDTIIPVSSLSRQLATLVAE